MKWFRNVTNIEELRKEYRRLLKIHHPDHGGKNEDTREIIDEYDRLYAVLSHQSRASAPEADGGYQYTHEENEAFKAVMERVAHLNADIEIIGSWVWIFGGYEYRELLKSIGFKFAPKKKAWTWHFGEYRRRHSREVTIEEIRAKYGSETVNRRKEQARVSS